MTALAFFHSLMTHRQVLQDFSQSRITAYADSPLVDHEIRRDSRLDLQPRLYPAYAPSTLVTPHIHWKVPKHTSRALPLWAKMELESHFRLLVNQDHDILFDHLKYYPATGTTWHPNLAWEPSCWAQMAFFLSPPTSSTPPQDPAITQHINAG